MSNIRGNYNFPNVSVNYRYGLEENAPIPDFSQPINQKQINFSLIGKSNPGVTFGATKVIAEPLFEEFDEIVSINEGVYANTDTNRARFVQTTKILRLTGLNVINFGDNYTTANPIQLSFNYVSNPLIGGDGEIYDQPILDIITNNNAGLGGFSILDSGRFKGSHEVEGYTGESIFFTKIGTGFFGQELTKPYPEGWDYNSGTVEGTGKLEYLEFENGVFQGLRLETGDFSGVVTRSENTDIFVGVFTSPSGSTEVSLRTQDDDEFVLNSSGTYFETGALIFTTGEVAPTYIIESSSPGGGFVDQDDIRNGINYSNWNLLSEDPIDRQAYTHTIRNPNVDSVSPIFDIKRLNDTLHVAESEYTVTDKPNWYGGGDLTVDAVFRIGNPTDTFVTMRLEWGFLNTDSKKVDQITYNGQTIGGYLVKGPDLTFDSWKSLQQSDPKYNDLTIAQLKSSFPKYVRISKDMFEQSSSLVDRRVMLDSISEQFDTTYSYPSSALVATKINSTNFDNIPTRTYDAKLKKVWVPETYNIKHTIEDKRFRTNDISYAQPETLFSEPDTVFNNFSRVGQYARGNKNFGQSLEIIDNTLFVSDPDYGNHSQSHAREQGQIFVYKNMGKGMDHSNDYSFQMIRDGIPECSDLNKISAGAANLPDFDIVSNYGEPYNGTNNIDTPSRVIFKTTIAIIGLIQIKEAIAGYPASATHSLFLRVSPRKSADLFCTVSTTFLNLGSYKNLCDVASGVVIGTVRDLNQAEPDQVLKIVDFEGIRNTDMSPITIVNDSETDYIYVKFFTAQLRSVEIRSIYTPYGLIQYAYLGGFLENPFYGPRGIHPQTMSISSVTLSDQTMKYIDMYGDQNILDGKDSLLAHAAVQRVGLTTTGEKRGVIIFQLSGRNGFWYPFQFISHSNDYYINALSFFPNQKRFAAFFKRSGEINIYRVGDSGLFELEDTFPLFEGVFENFYVTAPSSTASAFIQAINSNKIVITIGSKVQGSVGEYHNALRGASVYDAAFVYKKDLMSGWHLDEIIFAQDYQLTFSGGPSEPPRIKTDGDWLMMSGYGAEANNFDYGALDTGIVILFRYNGKKYEFIKQFHSDLLKQVDADGEPKDIYTRAGNEARFFGEFSHLKLDENNEPVVVAISQREVTTDPTNTVGYIYTFKRDTHTNEWISEKYNPFNGFEFVAAQNFVNIAFDGKSVALLLDRHLSLPDRVGLVSIKGSRKSTRVFEHKNWFGVMKKAWSDNPAWIIYDLLTNPIYGAGAVLDDFKDINVFNFFEVAKYFDSVDDDGFYLPIYDERGRTEPRLSCNFLLENDFNAFEVISSICDMFFGAVYIKDGKYNIWADMPKETSWYFNNYDVMDGNFSYSDTAKSSRVSVIKVPYLDKYETFKEKVEFIEDEDLIRKNGKNEAKLDFTTFTSRSQARRFGKHYLYNKSYETEKIKFLTDGKALFLSPGDVIGVNDELKSFKNQKAFYEVSEIEHTEKVYAVSPTESGAFTTNKSFVFSEITFNRASTNDFEVTNTIEANPRNDTLLHYNLCLDNSGVPHVLTQGAGVCDVFKKNSDGFDKVFLDQGTSSYQTNDAHFENNLAFDIYNNPYLSIVESEAYPQSIALTFSKLTGNDFTNSGHWQFTRLGGLYNDPAQNRAFSNRTHKSIIRINSNDDKYILTYVVSEPTDDLYTAEYLLYHCSGGLNDTDSGNWNRHVVATDSVTNFARDRAFDMQLTNNGRLAFIYIKKVEGTAREQIRYKELTGTNIGLESDWADVFVQGTSDLSSTKIRLKIDELDIPYVLHNPRNQTNTMLNRFIIYPESYTGRFSYKNWSDGTNFISKVGNYDEDEMSLEFLQNGNALIFSNNYPRTENNYYYYESLQFEESSDKKEWGQTHNWRKQFVYKTDFLADTSNNRYNYTPSIAYSFTKNSITLKNHDSFLYDNAFDIDTSIENNLEITKLSRGDVSELYKETQFKNLSSKIREEANTESKYLTVTGFETSGNYINLFLKKDIENAKTIKQLSVSNPMVRPIAPTGDGYKEYRVINILEKEQNLYEVEAKEYFSGKFDAIDTFSNMVEPEEAEFNIGLPTNEVIRPPEPSGVEFITGLDDAGSPFLTGMITGEPNGSETEYRLSLLYPNGRVLEKEIEKNTNTLSSSNEPLTDFGFYNLAAVGNYELNIKSLRNPESSTFINKEFTISKTKDKLSTYPFINDIGLLVNEDLLNIKIRTRNVYGDNLNLFDSNCRINLIIEDETYVENSKITDFEISFQRIKELTNSSLREKEIKAQLTYNGTVISEKSKILKDEAPKITNVNFISDGLTAGIVAEVEENEKLISIDMKTGENTIKTFAIENQNRLQTFKLQDFEISKLPKKQKIDFNFIPRDFYGTGQALNCEGYIPEKESLFQKYNNSIIGIYSIYSEDVISNGFSNYESSNNQSGFYGNGEDCLVEFSSSLLSGKSASLNLELVSDTKSNSVSIKFEDEGFLSSKKIMNLSEKYHNVRVSGESGLFGGFDLKIKKLV